MAKKNSAVVAALAVIGLIGAAAGGSMWRERLEFGKGGKPLSLAAGQDGSKLVASIDGGAPESDPDVMYYRVQGLLEEMFVDPVKDKEKLALGAIKGMVGSLADPNAVYFDAKQFSAYKKGISGTVEGIGVELAYKYDEEALRKYLSARRQWFEEKRLGKDPKPLDVDMSTLVPDIQVVAVHTGSTAEKAGLQPGDLIDQVDGKTVISGRFRKGLELLMKEIRGNKVSNDRARELVKEYETRAKNSIPPARAFDKLKTGTTGEVSLSWLVNGDPANLKTGRATLKSLKVPSIGIRQSTTALQLRLWEGASEGLKGLLEKGTADEIELRNVPNGSYSELKKCLSLFLKSGEYGFIKNSRKKSSQPFKIEGTPVTDRQLTLYVDGNTPSYPAIFAMVLQKAGRAKVVGEFNPHLHPAVVEVVEVQGGAGYLLPIGDFTLEASK